MNEKIDQILLDYQESVGKALQGWSGDELLRILDANRKLYVIKISNLILEEIINKLREVL